MGRAGGRAATTAHKTNMAKVFKSLSPATLVQASAAPQHALSSLASFRYINTYFVNSAFVQGYTLFCKHFIAFVLNRYQIMITPILERIQSFIVLVIKDLKQFVIHMQDLDLI